MKWYWFATSFQPSLDSNFNKLDLLIYLSRYLGPN